MRALPVAVASLAVGITIGLAVPVTPQVIVRTTPMPQMGGETAREPAETPYADSLVDWEELERDTDCLWVILQEQFGHDITMDRVTAAHLWTYELGGACHLIGED